MLSINRYATLKNKIQNIRTHRQIEILKVSSVHLFNTYTEEKQRNSHIPGPSVMQVHRNIWVWFRPFCLFSATSFLSLHGDPKQAISLTGTDSDLRQQRIFSTSNTIPKYSIFAILTYGIIAVIRFPEFSHLLWSQISHSVWPA